MSDREPTAEELAEARDAGFDDPPPFLKIIMQRNDARKDRDNAFVQHDALEQIGMVMPGVKAERDDWKADALRLREAADCRDPNEPCCRRETKLEHYCSACQAIAAHDELVKKHE